MTDSAGVVSALTRACLRVAVRGPTKRVTGAKLWCGIGGASQTASPRSTRRAPCPCADHRRSALSEGRAGAASRDRQIRGEQPLRYLSTVIMRSALLFLLIEAAASPLVAQPNPAAAKAPPANRVAIRAAHLIDPRGQGRRID